MMDCTRREPNTGSVRYLRLLPLEVNGFLCIISTEGPWDVLLHWCLHNETTYWHQYTHSHHSGGNTHLHTGSASAQWSCALHWAAAWFKDCRKIDLLQASHCFHTAIQYMYNVVETQRLWLKIDTVHYVTCIQQQILLKWVIFRFCCVNEIYFSWGLGNRYKTKCKNITQTQHRICLNQTAGPNHRHCVHPRLFGSPQSELR